MNSLSCSWIIFFLIVLDKSMQYNVRRFLQTPDMEVATYNAKFCKLARYDPLLVPTEAVRVQMFVHGLVGSLFNPLAPNISTMTYSEAVDLARDIKDKG